MDKQATLVSLGEVLWDVFPDGPRFGGAPANVACHAAALGANVAMVSQVGDDELGKQALAELARRGVDAQYVGVSDEFPTGTVQVALDGSGKPKFTIAEHVAWDRLVWSDALDALAMRTDAVCFGTLGQRHAVSLQVIGRFLGATPPGALRILDINLRAPFDGESVILHSLNLANVLKLSDEELAPVASACGIDGSEETILSVLVEAFGLHAIALTRGERGATLIRGEQRSDVAGTSVLVEDTVGAGDAFTATLILGLLNKEPVDTINERASRVAAYVCTQSGATPPLPPELRAS